MSFKDSLDLFTSFMTVMTLVIVFLFLGIGYQGNPVEIFSSHDVNTVQNYTNIEDNTGEGIYLSPIYYSPYYSLDVDSVNYSSTDNKGYVTVYTSENNFSTIQDSKTVDAKNVSRAVIDLKDSQSYRIAVAAPNKVDYVYVFNTERQVLQDYSFMYAVIVFLALITVIILLAVKYFL